MPSRFEMTPKLNKVLQAIQNGNNLTKVDLSNCNLYSIPSELYKLKDSLTFLNLGNNNLEDLPDEFSAFQKLEILFVPSNRFTQFPNVVGNLSSLFMVSFKFNQIVTIPETSLNPSIGWLILTSNKIEKLPRSIGNLKKLRKCMLAGNNLKCLPSEISLCKELELLRISSNQLEKFPICLLELPKLAWLAFANNSFNQELQATRSQGSFSLILFHNMFIF